jgi:hypothetical protein
MRTKYTLWKANNGWILVPEDAAPQGISHVEAEKCVVFKTLKEFADFKPKRERKRRTNKQVRADLGLTQPKEEHANIT